MNSRDQIPSSSATPLRPTTFYAKISTSYPGLAILFIAALLSVPCLRVGLPEGHDSYTHSQYQHYFSGQFWHGDLYPRWLSNANKGYGAPIFLIQYPLPYFVTALLRPILSFQPTATREARELGVFCFLVLATAGLAARAWLCKRYSPIAATCAAITYISLPYILGVDLYQRAAIGELCAFVWMPLGLALCDSQLRGFMMASALGVIFALLLMTHIISAALFTPLLIGYAIAGRSARVSVTRRVAAVFAALLMGSAIAAVYLVPLAYYKGMFHLEVMPVHVPSMELGRYFLFVRSDSKPTVWVGLSMALAVSLALFAARYVVSLSGHRIWRTCAALALVLGLVIIVPGLGPKLILLSGLKVSSFDATTDFSFRILVAALATLALGIVAFCHVATQLRREREQLLLMFATASFVLMLPWSSFFWKAIPQLSVLQFPYRLCTILTVAVAGLFGAAVDNCLRDQTAGAGKRSPIVLMVMAVAVIGTGILALGVFGRFKSPTTSRVAAGQDVDFMYRTYVVPERLAAFDRILGKTPDLQGPGSVAARVEARVRAECASGEGAVDVASEGPRELRIHANCSGGSSVRIGQLYSPLWRVEPMTGQSGEVPLLERSPDGLVEVPSKFGRKDFLLVYREEWPERVGIAVTMASLFVSVAGAVFDGIWRKTRGQHGFISAAELRVGDHRG